MKRLEPIQESEVPGHIGRKRGSKYDQIISDARSLAPGQAVPWQCDTKDQVGKARQAMKSFNRKCCVRGLILYVATGPDETAKADEST